jgi:HIV Tat-specific factor 1
MASASPPAASPYSFPTDPSTFDADERISYSTLDKKFILVADDGNEYEYDDGLKRWVPILDDELLAQQQAAYKVEGVDDEDTVDVIRNRKRKKEYVNGEDENGRAVKPAKKPKNALPPRQNTAVYVTGLPLDATVEEVAQVFSRKCGVIAEEIDSGKPRIKMYTDEKGNFKGDALVVFFKAPSVDMAITLLDDTEFRYSELGGSGKMRVVAADMSYKKVQNNTEDGGATAQEKRPKTSMKDKQKIIKKTQKLDARLADWDDDDPSALHETGTGFGHSKPQKVVILKHMFTLEELAEDPAAILDIKEDIREECTKLGEVTNVVLYDLEPEGIASVRFKEEDSAWKCVQLMNGRAFAGQRVEAYVSEGKERFRKSKEKVDDAEREGEGEP